MRKEIWTKRNGTAAVLILLFLTGIGLMVYPLISTYWNDRQQEKLVQEYAENAAEDTHTLYETLLAEADAYNEELGKYGIQWVLTEEEKEEYQKYLSIDDTGIMGYIEIPAIDCSLPIYHGTEEAVLQVGVGHVEGSSLPVGGESAHCVLSGHSGLASARLFTDLDQLREGDVFQIHTLDRVLTYEIDQICVVEPTDFSELQIEEGQDYCTLLTCTPYGINTHRLLVRGHRSNDAWLRMYGYD